MKKVVSVLLLVAVIATSAFAVDLSIGASFNSGLPVFYGDGAKDLEELYDSEIKGKMIVNPQVDVLISFSPMLSLETGIGYMSSKGELELDFGGGLSSAIEFSKQQLVIPVMVRGTFGDFYVSGGVKAGIPIGAYVPPVEFMGFELTPEVKGAFAFDLAVAAGYEYEVVPSHNIGVRIGYDLNILKPYDKESYGDDVLINHDDFLFGLTYRMAL